MNIADVTINWDEYKGCSMMRVITEKQDNLRELYKIPLCDLDIPADQERLKWFAWCVTEEAAEAIEVLMTTDHKEHLIDETADMTAFFLELLIVSRYPVGEIESFEWENQRDLDQVPKIFTEFITSLAITMNTLKNRDWRKTNVKTDKQLFYARMKNTVELFFKFVKAVGLTSHEFYDGSLRKYEVNLFRIRSKY
jgi:hypothetical protein